VYQTEKSEPLVHLFLIVSCVGVRATSCVCLPLLSLLLLLMALSSLLFLLSHGYCSFATHKIHCFTFWEKISGIWSIQNTAYLPPLSVCRLLLFIPLNYHVISGTRLRCTILYALFHAFSAVVILGHFFAFGNLASKPLDDNALVPMSPIVRAPTKDMDMYSASNDTVHYYTTLPSYYWVDTKADQKLDEIIQDRVPDEIKQYDLIWILLTLSLLSIGLHVVILLHVRSTAPTNDAMKRKFEDANNGAGAVSHYLDYGIYSGHKRLGYWIYHQFKKGNSNPMMMEEISNNGFSQSSRCLHLKMTKESDGERNDSKIHHLNNNQNMLNSSEHSDLESGLSVESFMSESEMDPFLNNEDLYSIRSLVHGDHPRRGLNRRRGVNFGKLIGIERCFSNYSRGGCKYWKESNCENHSTTVFVILME
jgi:hypothetical protein